jgi:hypothetical protein
MQECIANLLYITICAIIYLMKRSTELLSTLGLATAVTLSVAACSEAPIAQKSERAHTTTQINDMAETILKFSTKTANDPFDPTAYAYSSTQHALAGGSLSFAVEDSTKTGNHQSTERLAITQSLSNGEQVILTFTEAGSNIWTADCFDNRIVDNTGEAETNQKTIYVGNKIAEYNPASAEAMLNDDMYNAATIVKSAAEDRLNNQLFVPTAEICDLNFGDIEGSVKPIS